MTVRPSDAPALGIDHKAGRREQWGTRAMFLAAGLAIAAWAPLVPFAKARTGMSEGSLGLVLLCLGLGSLVAMPLTGFLANRFGCRKVLIVACIGLAGVLPMLALADDVVVLALSLAVFGAVLGTADVAVNIQAVMVEKDSGRSMMSGFHGLFSLGGIVGAGGVSLLMYAGSTPLLAMLVTGGFILMLLGVSLGGLLPYGNREAGHTPFIVVPRGIVLFIGILCFISFLAEGALLDWSALFLIERHAVGPVVAGMGYAAFSVAMTFGRLTGDMAVERLGGKRIIAAGGLLAATGFALIVFAPNQPLAFAGLVLVGLGASNVVPVLFTAAGAQTSMPPSLAIAAVTTIAYAGILIGPAAIGGIAQVASLGTAFLLLAAALVLVAIAGPRMLRG